MSCKLDVRREKVVDTRGADLFSTLANKLTTGVLSTLVATRLAFLPKALQKTLAGKLGVLVAFISLADASELVKAHADHTFELALVSLRESLQFKIRRALAELGELG